MSWLACEQPERPPDPYVQWHVGRPCRGCLFKIELQEHRFPDDPHVTFVAEWLRAIAKESC